MAKLLIPLSAKLKLSSPVLAIVLRGCTVTSFLVTEESLILTYEKDPL